MAKIISLFAKNTKQFSVFPKYSADINDRLKKYRANFGQFVYDLEIRVGVGFNISLSIGEGNQYPKEITKENFSGKLIACKNWKRRIIQEKIKNSEFRKRHVLLKRPHSIQVCAALDDIPMVFRCLETKTLTEVSKSFEVLEVKSKELYEDRRARDQVKIDELKDWECYRHWERLDKLLESALDDLQRWLKYVPGQMSDREMNDLAKRCLRMKIQHKLFKDHRGRGITILGYDFKYFEAASQFIYAVDAETKHVPKPGYDMIKG